MSMMHWPTMSGSNYMTPVKSETTYNKEYHFYDTEEVLKEEEEVLKEEEEEEEKEKEEEEEEKEKEQEQEEKEEVVLKEEEQEVVLKDEEEQDSYDEFDSGSELDDERDDDYQYEVPDESLDVRYKFSQRKRRRMTTRSEKNSKTRYIIKEKEMKKKHPTKPNLVYKNQWARRLRPM